MQNQLIPTNWQLAKLGDISSDISYGYTASATSEPTGVRLLRITDIQNNTVNWQSVPNCKIDPEKIDKYRLKPRDLVFARTGATVGKSHLLKGEILKAVYASYLIRVRCLEDISIEFLSSYFRSPYYWRQITDFSAGIGQPNVNGTKLKHLSVPIPPLAEQKVIADKLDPLLAQVENTKARLERIPQILKRFRQSVLAAAVNGRLMEEWREGDTPERNFKKLGDAEVEVKTGPFGSALHKSDYMYGGIPVINPMHISEGVITPSESMTISHQKYIDLEAWHLRKGDVVVGRRGEMGRAAVVESDESHLCGTGSMILRVGSNALPKYLEIVLRSPTAVSYFNSASVGSTMVNLNQKVIKNLEIYFPSLKEQTEIVRRVDQLFVHADCIEQQVNNALARVNNLTQSILAKAFRGELTEQWRKDNPELISGENSAEALLERIRAERAATQPAKKTRKQITA